MFLGEGKRIHLQLSFSSLADDEEVQTDDETSSVPVKIEALAKQFKTHRCALDFDHAFIKTVL
jgi:hypothetical protein